MIRHTIEDGASMARSFSLSEDGEQLLVEHRVDHPERGTKEFRLVYDRA